MTSVTLRLDRWLIDRKTRKVEIYRPHQPIQVLAAPATLSDAKVLPGLKLNLNQIW